METGDVTAEGGERSEPDSCVFPLCSSASSMCHALRVATRHDRQVSKSAIFQSAPDGTLLKVR